MERYSCNLPAAFLRKQNHNLAIYQTRADKNILEDGLMIDQTVFIVIGD